MLPVDIGHVCVGDPSEKAMLSPCSTLRDELCSTKSSLKAKEGDEHRLSSATMMASKVTRDVLSLSSHIVSRSAQGVIDNGSPDTSPKSISVWVDDTQEHVTSLVPLNMCSTTAVGIVGGDRDVL